MITGIILIYIDENAEKKGIKHSLVSSERFEMDVPRL